MPETLTEVKAEPYTVHDTLSLLTASYRYSRGFPYAQQNIFQFLAANYGKRFNDDVIERTIPVLVGVAGKHVFCSGIHPATKLADVKDFKTIEEGIKSDVSLQVRYLQQLLEADTNERDLFTDFQDLARIDEFTIPFADEKPFYEKGVPLRYKSNLINHGFLGRTTHVPEMDHYFRAVMGAYDQALADQQYLGNPFGHFPKVAAAHLAYNPEDTEPLMAAVSDR